MWQATHYAHEYIAEQPDPEWFDTTLSEVKAFLGLHVLFGIKQLPATRLYWSNDPLIGVWTVQKVMFQNHFHKLSKYFHLNNNANPLPHKNLNHDKLFKVLPLFLLCYWTLSDRTETRKGLICGWGKITFKGRLGMKQYMSMKPLKQGIEV